MRKKIPMEHKTVTCRLFSTGNSIQLHRKTRLFLNDSSLRFYTVPAQHYEQEMLESELRPEYAEKLQKIKKEKGICFKSVKQLRQSIENARV